MTAPNPPMVCLGDSVVIEVNSGFLNYWWNTGNPLDQDEDRVVVYPTQDFTYVVEALDVNGCESREEIQVFVDTCATNIDKEIFNRIKIYPNPAESQMFIQLPINEFFHVSLFDINGRLILEKQNQSLQTIISNEHVSKGVYTITIYNSKGLVNRKIIFK